METVLNHRGKFKSVTVFRAYDIRGVYGADLNEELAKRVGKSFGSYAEGKRIALGRDTRISGPSLEKAFLEGVLSTGCDVQSYGVIPIAVLSYATWKDGLKAGAYISASHNPPEYNGIRFRTGDGYGMLYHDTEIMKFYNQGGFLEGLGHTTYFSPDNAIEEYSSHISGKLDIDGSLRIVLDMGNGSACTMGSFYQHLGLDTILINSKMDGNFPGRGPAPTEESLKHACKEVLENKAHYGVGFDPDADRGIVIDDKGQIVPPEKVAIIIALRRYKPGDIIISGFDCSMILERQLEPEGIKVQRERVGDVFVANRVKNSDAVLGVERSGHFFLPEFQYSDDPFAMSLALGEIISQGEKLSQMADLIPDFPYLQKSIRIEGDPKKIMLRLKDELARMEPDTTDGLKITTESYSILIRPSNTEPLLRLYIETTRNDLEQLEKRFERIIKAAIKPE